MPTFQPSVELPFSAETVFNWHEQPHVFERLNPPWEVVKLLKTPQTLANGETGVFQIPMAPALLKRLLPWPAMTWVAEHHSYEPGQQFADKQLSGPFATWNHIHRVETTGDQTSRLTDDIDYTLPLGLLGDLAGGEFIRHKLKRMFRYRHTITRNDLHLHQRYSQTPLRVAISGSSGLIGQALTAFLRSGGHTVIRLVRDEALSKQEKDCIVWDPTRAQLDDAAHELLNGLDGWVHLNGDNIAEGRWTAAKKDRLISSRLVTSRYVATICSELDQPPKVVLAASAQSIYGTHPDHHTPVDETTALGGVSFLTQLAKDWEAAIAPVSEQCRLVNLRIGLVLTPAGGALGKLQWPFLLGAGSPFGAGTQPMSWLTLDDMLGLILHCLVTEAVNGPVNVCSPDVCSHQAFAQTVADVCHRPCWPNVPAPIIKTLMGEMGEACLLQSTAMEPKALLDSGYEFLFPALEGALNHVLGIHNVPESLVALA